MFDPVGVTVLLVMLTGVLINKQRKGNNFPQLKVENSFGPVCWDFARHLVESVLEDKDTTVMCRRSSSIVFY